MYVSLHFLICKHVHLQILSQALSLSRIQAQNPCLLSQLYFMSSQTLLSSSLASKLEDKTVCGDQVQDLGKQEQRSAYMHTNGLLFCLFPLISCICCFLICCKAPLSLPLALSLQCVTSFAHSHNSFKTSQDKFYTQQSPSGVSCSRFVLSHQSLFPSHEV